MTTWITNDAKVAKMLRKADKAYEAARTAAKSLSLADKIVALRAAQEAKQAAYAKVMKSERRFIPGPFIPHDENSVLVEEEKEESINNGQFGVGA
jgi:ABC-type nitrate/sulfonate/bicarbonate transport system substrate-binding protein